MSDPLFCPEPKPPEPLLCSECGGVLPARSLHMVCLACLARRHLRVMLERERVVWSERPPSRIELARGRGLNHIVLDVDHDLTYCGQKPAQARAKRLQVGLSDLNQETCTDCRSVFDRLRQDAQGA